MGCIKIIKLFLFKPIFITFILILTTCSLGYWQLQRLSWKNNLIKSFNEFNISDPIDLSPTLNKEFVKIKSEGIIYRNHKIFFPAKTYNGKVGYRLASKFISNKGDTYLIDEGWFSNSDFKYFQNNTDIFNVNLLGYIRYPIKRKLFTPNNNKINNEWYTYDLKEISNYLSSPINKIIFIKKINSNKENFLIPSSYKHQFNNNHLQYAITWFSMSFAFLIMFLVYVKKNKNE